MSTKTNPKVVAILLLSLFFAFVPNVYHESNEPLPDPCNGSPYSCDKSYTDVTFPETHNAHASLDEDFNYLAANHRLNMSHQWDAGYRAFMLDLHHDKFSQSVENTSFCHGSYDTGVHPCTLGSQNAIELLSELHEKMNSSTRDVVTLLFEVYVPYSHISHVLNMSGLMERVHTQTLNEPWPTLGEMVENGKNLVIFVESAPDENYPYLHSFTVHGWTTNYAERAPEDMNCDVLRGDSSQPVWHMNNWLALESGLTDYVRAPIVNDYDFLLNRSLECWQAHGTRPTFIAVDWWTDGDAVNVSRTLNAMDHWSDEVPLLATTDPR